MGRHDEAKKKAVKRSKELALIRKSLAGLYDQGIREFEDLILALLEAEGFSVSRS